MPNDPTANDPAHASAAEITRILGTVDERVLLEIMALRPTIRDVEEAAELLSGDLDIFGPGEPQRSTAGEIITILTADEEEEQRPG